MVDLPLGLISASWQWDGMPGHQPSLSSVLKMAHIHHFVFCNIYESIYCK